MRHKPKAITVKKKKVSEYKPGTAAFLQEHKLEYIAKIDLQKASTE